MPFAPPAFTFSGIFTTMAYPTPSVVVLSYFGRVSHVYAKPLINTQHHITPSNPYSVISPLIRVGWQVSSPLTD